MYAVIETGGKQYRVRPGQALRIEKLEVEPGKQIDFDKVLMVADGDDINIGQKYLEGARVSATVLDQDRAKKIHILKFKRRKHHMKQMGHRQYFTLIKIDDIKKG